MPNTFRLRPPKEMFSKCIRDFFASEKSIVVKKNVEKYSVSSCAIIVIT